MVEYDVNIGLEQSLLVVNDGWIWQWLTMFDDD